MSAVLLYKIAIIVLLILILASLSSGMFFLVKDKGQTNRTVNSLTVRVALSITLFVMLIVGFKFGLIRPHGLLPEQTQKALP